MEADISDRPDRKTRTLRAWHIMGTETGAVAIEQGEDFVGVPRRLAKFEDVGNVLGHQPKEALQPLQVKAKPRWKLVEDRPQGRPEMTERIHHPAQRCLTILQLLGLRQEAVRFDRITKSCRCLFAPGIEGLWLG